jgi:predicted exporter
MPERNAELVRRAEQQAWSAVTRATGQMATQAAPPHAALDAETWLASPASKAIRGQWLGDMDGQSYSLVMLRGVQQSNLAEIEAAGDGLTGVQWVNRTAQISDLIARYRDVMLGYLLAGYTGVLLLLLWRFRRQAWRALMPTILGTLMTLSIFGWIGEPIQLFTVLALLLLLGMGVDYGIFLLEHPGDGSAWVAVALAGVSTLLSFGLLGLSATPALRAFGLTMLIGEISIWILTPFFRPTAPTTQPHGH